MKTKQATARRWGVNIAILALGAGASTWSAAPAQAKILGLSEQDEIRAGQQVAAQAQREYGRALPASDPMSRRVNTIGRRFVGIAKRRNIPYTYTVLQNDKVLNAFAAPGGPIFVTTRLIKTTSNDAELAYVLGHETAHIEQRHIAESVEKQQKTSIGVGILGAILGRKVNPNIVNAVAGIGMQVLQSGYSRKDENDADAVGVRMMSRLGYDPRASLTMLRKLGAEGGSRGGGIDKYLATHPAPDSRVKSVSAQIQKEGLIAIARQNGGPRLSDSGSASGGGYSNVNDQYPDDDYGSGSGNVYPTQGSSGGAGGSSNGDYPDYSSIGGSRGDGGGSNAGGPTRPVQTSGGVDLGGPLRLVERGDTTIILAPAAGVARWASARSTQTGPTLTLQRKNRTLVLRRDSAAATLNGQALNLSVATDIANGRLYAPLGSVVEAVGGTARFDESIGAVRLQLDGRESLVYLPR